MAKEYKITSLRLNDLEKELNYLKTTREREIAAMIAEARSYGDLSENSEYDAAKNEQAKLYGRIAEIEDILSHAVIIEDESEILAGEIIAAVTDVYAFFLVIRCVLDFFLIQVFEKQSVSRFFEKCHFSSLLYNLYKISIHEKSHFVKCFNAFYCVFL